MIVVDESRITGDSTVNASMVEQEIPEPQIDARQSSCLPQPDLVRYDVAKQDPNLNLKTISILEDAPVWMTVGERLLLYTLAYTLRPQHYLEIGTFQGGSALIVSSAMDALDSTGHLYCIDPNPQISPETWAKLEHRTTVFEGCSPHILQDESELADNLFDVVLIDGDHSYSGVLKDAEGILPLVCSQGYIIFHDGFGSDVKQAIDEFVENNNGKVVDLGLLTREITIDTDGNQWGGLRLVYVL